MCKDSTNREVLFCWISSSWQELKGDTVLCCHVNCRWLDNTCYNTYIEGVKPITLHDELKMTKPFRSLEEEAMLSIARTAAVIEHTVSEALKPHELTPTQYNVLRILRGAGEVGLCRNEVGQRLVTRCPT